MLEACDLRGAGWQGQVWPVQRLDLVSQGEHEWLAIPGLVTFRVAAGRGQHRVTMASVSAG